MYNPDLCICMLEPKHTDLGVLGLWHCPPEIEVSRLILKIDHHSQFVILCKGGLGNILGFAAFRGQVSLLVLGLNSC